MYQVTVYVTYKTSILDPQGEAVKRAVHHLGYSEISDIRIGKYFELTIEKSDTPVEEAVEAICKQLLANVVMETYRYEIREVAER